MTKTRRERIRAATINEIKEIARQQMGESGAGALSLRAISREMGMSSPALYRYFASRDDLVTALLVDVYTAFADALEMARDGRLQGDHIGRFTAVACAYRDWAVASPQEYALIFGVPIPGYKAPSDVTSPIAARSMIVFLDVLVNAEKAGKADFSDSYVAITPAVAAQLQPWVDKLQFDGDIEILYTAMSNWSLMHGLVSLEIFGHFDLCITDVSSGELYRTEVAALAKRLSIQ